MTGPIDPRRLTTLYRLFDGDDQLLYVGTSVDPQNRWEQHAREKLWWSAVARATVEWHPDRTSAMAAERAAIKAEEPLHNDKATPDEAVFPYRGARGPSVDSRLRRAVVEHRSSLDRLAVAVNRAALSGLAVAEIAETAGLDEGDVSYLAKRMEDGGGSSALAKHTPYSREWARKIADRIDKERAAKQAEVEQA
ncbi:GIY-YIG nuclease family protein [Streptomyces sp. ME02-7008A-1]|uniref:GIY-YIG nuclease family protein n=1 Tax=Streptomyces TaxID=1883 RepID=UPI0029A3052E|nr:MULTISPECIES: GIY-YIG nuclease family protein [unclassified Streptomyces]MDX3183512.1 GIY-YIG nuclease family protein [Streptomyces sp. ME02-7008A-1]MDX3303964.1 GIY-YIG nuclease family protein [Streptomyces sp. ME02-7008A]